MNHTPPLPANSASQRRIMVPSQGPYIHLCWVWWIHRRKPAQESVHSPEQWPLCLLQPACLARQHSKSDLLYKWKLISVVSLVNESASIDLETCTTNHPKLDGWKIPFSIKKRLIYSACSPSSRTVEHGAPDKITFLCPNWIYSHSGSITFYLLTGSIFCVGPRPVLW
jgi:hypothetical protein